MCNAKLKYYVLPEEGLTAEALLEPNTVVRTKQCDLATGHDGPHQALVTDPEHRERMKLVEFP